MKCEKKLEFARLESKEQIPFQSSKQAKILFDDLNRIVQFVPIDQVSDIQGLERLNWNAELKPFQSASPNVLQRETGQADSKRDNCPF